MIRIGTIGDVDPIEHGGGAVFGGEEGAGDSLSKKRSVNWWVEWTDGETGDGELLVYRADLHGSGRQFLSWYDWVDWDQIADFGGVSIHELSASQLETAMDRAHALWLAATYHGWKSFDEQPMRLSAEELDERWYDEPEENPRKSYWSMTDAERRRWLQEREEKRAKREAAAKVRYWLVGRLGGVFASYPTLKQAEARAKELIKKGKHTHGVRIGKGRGLPGGYPQSLKQVKTIKGPRSK